MHKMLCIGIAVATAIAAPAFAQSNPPPVPTVPPDLTLTCLSEIVPGTPPDQAHPITAQIWTSAHVLTWNALGDPPPRVFSTEVGPAQISFSGTDPEYPQAPNVKGVIDRLSGRFSYKWLPDPGRDTEAEYVLTGTCAPAAGRSRSFEGAAPAARAA